MNAFSDAIRIIHKRPLILLAFGIIMLVAGLASYYNPIYTIIFGFGALSFGDILNSIISFLNLFTGFLNSPLALLEAILIVIAFMAIVALLLGLGFSGIFNIVNNAATDKPKSRGEFLSGLKAYYFKVSVITFKVLLTCIIFMISLMVVSVPAIIITQAWIAGKAGLLVSALTLDIITVLVLFFCIMFFMMYVLFWYTAAINSGKKSFAFGKRTADSSFWKIFKRLLLINIIFVAYQLVMLYAERIFLTGGTGETVVSFILYIVNCILNTYFAAFLTTYIFLIFNRIVKSKQES